MYRNQGDFFYFVIVNITLKSVEKKLKKGNFFSKGVKYQKFGHLAWEGCHYEGVCGTDDGGSYGCRVKRLQQILVGNALMTSRPKGH